MSYDEQRISDQIDGGLHKMKEMEKKQTALMELYDKILPYTTNGKELLAVDVLTLIQEKYLPKEREQIEEAYKADLPLDDNPDYMADKYYKKTFAPSPCVNS